MATEVKFSAVKVMRSKKTAAMPPCQIAAFPKLLEPDQYGDNDPKFKVRGHYNPAGIEALKKFIQVNCIDAHFPALKAEVDAMNKAALEAKPKKPTLPIVADISGCQSPEEFLEGKLKEPHEKSKIQLPMIEVATKADIKKKDGTIERREMVFWDAKNNVIDGAQLKMGAGTVIQPIVHANLFLSKTGGKDPRPQLQLVGIRVMKYVPYGGGGQPQSADEATEEEMRAIMGDDYDAGDDLSSFMAGGAKAAPVDDSDLPF